MKLKQSLLKLCLIFFCTSLFAQYEVTIEATILDKETKHPIAFANIGFIDKSIGTVSKEDGQFKLVYDEVRIGNSDILQISFLGYETLKITTAQLFELLSKDNKLYLNPKPLALDEIVLTYEKRKEIRLGDSKSNKTTLGYWKDKDALGGEIATRIYVKQKRTKLLDLKFNIVENLSDSLKIRVNIYNYKKRFPSEKLLNKNIFYTIKQKEGEVKVDLKPYNIKVDDDFIIGIELVKVYGETIGFAVSGKPYVGVSFRRYISQDKWKRHDFIGMSFSVLTSVLVNNTEKVSTLRQVPKKITLYWDTSLSMKKRVIDNELKLLSNYLKKIKTAEVEVIKFNMTVSASKQFQIKKGKGNILIDYLRNTNYEGASNFAQIVKRNNFNADAILLFTDGNTIFSELQSEINVPIFSINTLPKANHLRLQKASFYADGHYINLNKVSSKLALELMLNEVDDKTVYTDRGDNNTTAKHNIYGTVISASEPIQGAILRVKNSFTEAITDVDGNYSINANENDILIVDYFGMLKKEVL
ncbi:MAG: carboxypeptidase-like regulatory domain-containing protein, partial [Bacteroidetes bacterium]|nr:carboxypeptidase-like regulatory domain-containing protein [Bacteroidota bacterium]